LVLSKFLIIDDNRDKYEVIKNELTENGVREESIDWAESKTSALIYMRRKRYLVALLDLNLPEFDKKNPIENGGFEVLEKINLKRNSQKYKKPNYVICLSAFKEIREAQLDKFLNLDLSVHDFECNSWKTALKNKVDLGLEVVNDQNDTRKLTKYLAITIHGIRTQGEWQEELESSLIQKFGVDVVCKKYKYNYYSATKLLFSKFRSKVIEDFQEKLIELLEETPDAKVVFFAHSFGTYILMKALEDLPRDVDINIEKVVLAGCVLKESYDLKAVRNVVDKSRVINDCGMNDGILLLSKYFCSDMGMAGRSGLIGMDINNRHFEGKHDFFYKRDNFVDNYWIPLIGNEVKIVDERDFSTLRENWEILISSRLNLSIFFSSIAGISFIALYFLTLN
jgi:CheY-like chemotaxis protein